jgi:type VI secretion system protein ImpA
MTDTAAPALVSALETDIERALAPLPPRDAPVSLWADGTYAAIREALREDDPRLPQGIWETDRKRADPAHAADLALNALEMRAKDVYVAGWLLEAWTRLHGFAGARGGLQMLVRLCREQWHVLHPRAEENEPDARDRAWEHLAAQLPAALRRVPLAQPGPGGGDAFTWHDRQAALHREGRGGDEAGAPGSEDIEAATARTPTDFYAAALRDLGAAIVELDALQSQLREHAGAPPSLAAPHTALAEIRAWVGSLLAKRPAEEASAPEPPSGPEGVDGDPGPADGAAAGTEGDAAAVFAAPPGTAVRSRAEAYGMLAAAADFLARTEPHSPVPPLVRRAVAWGGLDLAGLYEEVLREGYDLPSLCTLLGAAPGERR